MAYSRAAANSPVPSGRNGWRTSAACLALRRDHGQIARLTTNYDAALLSVLYDAQVEQPMERRSNLCPLRSGIRADVVADDQPGSRYAAGICALIGAAKITDHMADDEGWPRYLPGLSSRLANRWTLQARQTAGARTQAVAQAAAPDRRGDNRGHHWRSGRPRSGTRGRRPARPGR